MKKIILNNSFITLLVLSITAILIYVYKSSLNINNGYITSTIDKQVLLKTPSKASRLILVSGSGMAFGMDSKQIHDSLNIDVINCGLHGGLGIKYPLNQVVYFAQKNDVVVLAFEYYLPLDGEVKLLAQAHVANESFRLFYPTSLSDIIRFFIANMQTAANKFFYTKVGTQLDYGVYVRNSFNVMGDIQMDKVDTHFTYLKDVNTMEEVAYQTEIKYINDQINFLKQKGANVYYAYPAICKSAYDLNQEKINRFAQIITSSFKCTIISKPQDMVFDDDFFYDTAYHLNKKGMQKRMPILIKALQTIK